eukprot:Pgem_evm1s16112
MSSQQHEQPALTPKAEILNLNNNHNNVSINNSSNKKKRKSSAIPLCPRNFSNSCISSGLGGKREKTARIEQYHSRYHTKRGWAIILSLYVVIFLFFLSLCMVGRLGTEYNGIYKREIIQRQLKNITKYETIINTPPNNRTTEENITYYSLPFEVIQEDNATNWVSEQKANLNYAKAQLAEDTALRQAWGCGLIIGVTSLVVVVVNGGLFFYYRKNIHVKGRNSHFIVTWFLLVTVAIVFAILMAAYSFLEIGISMHDPDMIEAVSFILQSGISLTGALVYGCYIARQSGVLSFCGWFERSVHLYS